MSAYKTAFIRSGTAEYQKLRDAEEQLRLHNLMQQQNHSKSNPDGLSIYDQLLGINQKNDRQFQNIVVSIGDEISRIEHEAADWVAHQTKNMQTEMDHYQATIDQRSSAQLNEFMTFANQKLMQKEEELNNYWFNQEERIASLENKWKYYESQARNWILKDQEVLDYIYESCWIDAQKANLLEMQREYINHVIGQYNDGLYDLATAGSFQIFIALSNMRTQMEIDHAVYMIQYQKMLGKADRLRFSLEDSRSVHAMDRDGNELPEMIAVDFWVEGRFQALEIEINQILDSIHPADAINQTNTIEYINQIDLMNERLVDLVTEARVNVLASQLRFNVAQIVVQALETQGFFLEQASYAKDDYRESFNARTRNLAGNEVQISIDPEPGLEEGGKLHIQSLDANLITEHELIQRNQEIFSAITDNGVEVDDIREVHPVSLLKSGTRDKLIPDSNEKTVSYQGKNNDGRY